MRDILRSVSKLSIPIGLNISLSLIKNKILSVVVGPIGLGIYSQIVNLSGLTYAILPIGSMGLIRYISRYYANERMDEISYILKYFFKRNLFFSIIFSITIILFRDTLSKWLFSGSDFSNLLVLFSIFIPLNLLLNFMDIYLKSIREINAYVLFLSANSLVSLVCNIPLIYFFGVEGAVLALILSVLLNLLTGFVILRRYKMFLNFKSNSVVEDLIIKNIYKIGIVGLVSMGIQNITFLSIRSLLAEKLGLNEVGIFQCVYSLSAGYFGIFFTLMGNYSIPKISSLKNTPEIIYELNSTAKFLLLIYIPLIIFMFVSRSYIIPILYSSDFTSAKYLLIFQLPAELVRAFSWIMGLWLLPNLKIKKWITFEIIFYFSFFCLSYILISFYDMGVKAISISYLCSYILFFFINYFYAAISINFRFSKFNVKFLLISIFFLFLIFFISNADETLGYYIFLPLLTFWAVLLFRKEDIKKIKEILQK